MIATRTILGHLAVFATLGSNLCQSVCQPSVLRCFGESLSIKYGLRGTGRDINMRCLMLLSLNTYGRSGKVPVRCLCWYTVDIHVRRSTYNIIITTGTKVGPLTGGGGGVLILHVEFKKAQCCPVEFKNCSCRPIEFKKCSCRPVYFKKCPCPMSLRPKIPHVALSILGV